MTLLLHMNCINLQCASICDAPNWPLHGAYQRAAPNNWKSLKYKWTPNLINLQHRIPTVVDSCSCCFLTSTLFFVFAVSTLHPQIIKTKKTWQSSQGQSLHSGRTHWSHAQEGILIWSPQASPPGLPFVNLRQLFESCDWAGGYFPAM